MKSRVFASVFLDTLPVMTGYVFLGFGFGILMYQNGYGFGWSLAMSVFLYAGSMQYMAVSLLSGGAGWFTVALTTFVVNARHLFYGLSMLEAYKGCGRRKNYLIFAMTDETYSLVSKPRPIQGCSRQDYCFWVSLLDQLYWIIGTVLGSLAGAVLPFNLKGIEFMLTALFVTIFVEQWLSVKDHRPACIGVLVTILCLLLFGKRLFMIPSMGIIALLLVFLQERGRRNAHV